MFGSLFSGLLIGVVSLIRLEGLLLSLLLFAIAVMDIFQKQIIKLTFATLIAPVIWFGRLLFEGNRGDIISPTRSSNADSFSYSISISYI